jgi:hypothetical protein
LRFATGHDGKISIKRFKIVAYQGIVTGVMGGGVTAKDNRLIVEAV